MASVLELARMVIELTGQSEDLIEFQPHKAMLGASYEDIGRRVPDISRIRSSIDWVPSTSLKDGLKAMIDYRRGEIAQGYRVPIVEALAPGTPV